MHGDGEWVLAGFVNPTNSTIRVAGSSPARNNRASGALTGRRGRAQLRARAVEAVQYRANSE